MEKKYHSHIQREKSRTKATRVVLLLLLSLLAASTLLYHSYSPSIEEESNVAVVVQDADDEPIDMQLSSNELDRNHLQVWKAGKIIRNSFDLGRCQDLIDGKRDYIHEGEKREEDGILCCDRSNHRTDVCYMKGEVRTNSTSKTILVHNTKGEAKLEEKIRPYTRKWETSVMSTIDELSLVRSDDVIPTMEQRRCDVLHDVTGVVMSSGGYTGNVYHEFNDGMVPLFLTTERFKGEVVLVVVEYHKWWFDKYEPMIRRMTNYEVVDFRRDKRIHCFPEMIVGLKIHGELSIDSSIMPSGKGSKDFQEVLEQAFGGGSKRDFQRSLTSNQLTIPSTARHHHRRQINKKPMIVIFIRRRSRALLNLRSLVMHCRKLGFQVQLLDPKRNTPLSDIHVVLHSADVMLAVHGAAITHFVFMRPGSVLVQIVPLGLDWAADEYYGQPSRHFGLHYIEYKVEPEESSLSMEYGRDDPVISNPTAITQKGWQETKRIYLQHQNVTLDLKRFRKILAKAKSIVR